MREPEFVKERLPAFRVMPVLRFNNSAQTRFAIDGLVVAGSVLENAQARDCIAAGADFLVSPCIVGGVAKLARDAGCAALLAAFTPSQVLAAVGEISDIVKLFPAASSGPLHRVAM